MSTEEMVKRGVGILAVFVFFGVVATVFGGGAGFHLFALGLVVFGVYVLAARKRVEDAAPAALAVLGALLILGGAVLEVFLVLQQMNLV